MHRVTFVSMLIASFVPILSTQDAARPADLVLLDGRVLTVDDQFRTVTALAIRDGRFVAVGSNEDVRAHIGNATRVVEGRGRTVIPGVIDTHVHALDVAAAESSQPFRNQIHRGAAGLDPSRGGTPRPRRLDLDAAGPDAAARTALSDSRGTDAVAPHHPAGRRRARLLGQHRGALQAAGIDRNSADPPGGAIVKDSAGEPTGLLRNVGDLLARFRPAAARVPLETLEQVHRQYLTVGITSVTSAPRSRATRPTTR